jgi:WD40 repeat protein
LGPFGKVFDILPDPTGEMIAISSSIKGEGHPAPERTLVFILNWHAMEESIPKDSYYKIGEVLGKISGPGVIELPGLRGLALIDEASPRLAWSFGGNRLIALANGARFDWDVDRNEIVSQTFPLDAQTDRSPHDAPDILISQGGLFGVNSYSRGLIDKDDKLVPPFLKVLELGTGRVVSVGRDISAENIGWNHEGDLIFSHERTIYNWQWQTNDRPRPIFTSNGEIFRAKTSQDGSLLAVLSDELTVLDLAGPGRKKFTPIATYSLQLGYKNMKEKTIVSDWRNRNIAWSPDNQSILTSQEFYMTLWKFNPFKVLQRER